MRKNNNAGHEKGQKAPFRARVHATQFPEYAKCMRVYVRLYGCLAMPMQ